MLMCCSGCTWREGQYCGHNFDRGCVNFVDDARGLLPVRVLQGHVVVCVSRFPLPDPVLVVVPDVVVFLLHLEGRTS